MAGKTFYPLNTKFAGVEHLEMQDGGAAPSTATMSTGWTVGTTAVGRYSRMDSTTERATATFSATVQPSGAPSNSLGDCFMAGPYTGNIGAGLWTLNFPVIAVTQGDYQAGRIRVRLWRSTNASGASATEIASGSTPGTSVSKLTTAAAQTSIVSLSPGAFSLTNEYLFVQIAWEITGTGIAGCDVLLRKGSAASITTPEFTTGATQSASGNLRLGGLATLSVIAPFHAAGDMRFGGLATMSSSQSVMGSVFFVTAGEKIFKIVTAASPLTLAVTPDNLLVN